MIYLVLSIVFFFLTTVIFSRAQRAKPRSGAINYVGNRKIVSLDEDISDDAEENDRSAWWIFLSVLTIALGVIFLIVFVVYKPRQKLHDLRISHEVLAVTHLATHLNQLFSTASTANPVDTLVVIFDDSNHYEKSLVHELTSALDDRLFKINSPYSILASGFSTDRKVVTSSALKKIVTEIGRTDLVIVLSSYEIDAEYTWQGRPKPYIVVFFENAELNDAVYLVNKGVVEVALVSKHTFEDHSLIPLRQRPEEIFTQNFLIITPGNVKQIVEQNKQIIHTLD